MIGLPLFTRFFNSTPVYLVIISHFDTKDNTMYNITEMKSLEFNVESRLPGTLARAGVVKTPHGEIKTPCFVAAGTKGTVKALTMVQVDELGAQAVLCNTYHLLLQPGVDLINSGGGLKKFINFFGPTFTDSGGFQIMSLPGVKITSDKVVFKSHIDGAKIEMMPESSMVAQHKIGADIHMAFDCPIGYGDSDTGRESAVNTLQITHDWAERCLVEHEKLNAEHEKAGENSQALYGVVQGGEFEDLRKQSAEFFAQRNFDGYGIGGMYTADQGKVMLPIMNSILPENKPRHWLGMGAEPIDLFVGVENGIDTFDCVAPTRQARNGALYTHDGRINIMNAKYRNDFAPIDAECDCWTCQNHMRAYLHHLFKAGELSAYTLATIHNERFVVRLCDQIRSSILDGTFATFRDKWLARYYKNKKRA